MKAKTYQVQPTMFDGCEYVVCSPEQATQYSMYSRPHTPPYLATWVADFGDEFVANRVARMLNAFEPDTALAAKSITPF